MAPGPSFGDGLCFGSGLSVAIRDRHGSHLRRIDALIERGRRSGAFRDDMPRPWQVATCYSLMHTAADECATGRLGPETAGSVVADTVLAALTPPVR